MGLTYIESTVSGPDGRQVTVPFLVDSGATYSLLPYDDWQAIGLEAKRSMRFTLADGTAIERQEAGLRLVFAYGKLV